MIIRRRNAVKRFNEIISTLNTPKKVTAIKEKPPVSVKTKPERGVKTSILVLWEVLPANFLLKKMFGFNFSNSDGYD